MGRRNYYSKLRRRLKKNTRHLNNPDGQFYDGIIPFTEKPTTTGNDRLISAHELFSLFTADIRDAKKIYFR